MISVAGGGVRHVKVILEQLQYGAGAYSALVVMVGGNDVVKGMRPAELVEQITGMVKETAERNPGCLFISSPILPRIPDKKVLVKSGEWFLGVVDEYDELMVKAGYWHHHWCTDTYVAEKDHRGTLPRLELFEMDNVHLNEKGLELFQELLTFVIDGINFVRWTDRKNYTVGEGYRSLFWSF